MSKFRFRDPTSTTSWGFPVIFTGLSNTTCIWNVASSPRVAEVEVQSRFSMRVTCGADCGCAAAQCATSNGRATTPASNTVIVDLSIFRGGGSVNFWRLDEAKIRLRSDKENPFRQRATFEREGFLLEKSFAVYQDHPGFLRGCVAGRSRRSCRDSAVSRVGSTHFCRTSLGAAARRLAAPGKSRPGACPPATRSGHPPLRV